MLELMRDKSERPRTERRRQRSNDPLTALHRLLEAARTREGLKALAVADESGLLVAGAGHFARCELLAAEAPLQASAKQSVKEVWVDGVRVLLSAEPGKPRIFGSLAEGCQRILGRQTPLRSAPALA